MENQAKEENLRAEEKNEDFLQAIKDDIQLVNQLMPELLSEKDPEEKKVLEKVSKELEEFEKIIDSV